MMFHVYRFCFRRSHQAWLSGLCLALALSAPASAQNTGIDLRQLGALADRVDLNHDGILSQQELELAIASGLFLFQGGMPQPILSQGVSFEEAQRTLTDINTRKMKPDTWGKPDPKTGIFSPDEANTMIRTYLEKDVLSSGRMSLSQKFSLIKALRMARDQWGAYLPFQGSLRDEDAFLLARRAAELSRPEPRPGAIRELIVAVVAERQGADKWGKDDPLSGLLSPADANALIRRMISEGVLTDRSLSPDQKLAIIKENTMQKDSWGADLPRTGALTEAEAAQLSRLVFSQPSQPSAQPSAQPTNPWQTNPFNPPGQPSPLPSYGPYGS